ncbi:MAG: DUF4080 domain-containing protein [Verrucomicrobiia bacterium]
MADIVLTTINAKYIHTAFGLRYLYANLGEMKKRAQILEFNLQMRPVDIAEAILNSSPKIVGIGVYIWNAREVEELVGIIKKVSPDTVVAVGGPEVSYEWETNPTVQQCDYVICGEADIAFGEFCRRVLSGEKPESKIISPPLPELNKILLPYEYYTDEDIRHRIIYVESSRGCPFKCEFCLSSLDIPVRYFPVELFLEELKKLIARGARQFKFVDRTFNLSVEHGTRILEFCLSNYQPGMFFHFELVPDRLPREWRDLISRFPQGSLQFEAGIQTFNPEVSKRIERRQNYARLEENLRFLRWQTRAHLHTDLIAGLPGEDLKSFGEGFDRLVRLRPQEIQVGILKRLRGAPIAKHTESWGMVYNSKPPYEVLKTNLISFAQMQSIKRFARYWDIIANSGNFVKTTELILGLVDGGDSNIERSPFNEFMALSEWLFSKVGSTTAISRARLLELLYEYLTSVKKHTPETVASVLVEDCKKVGFKELPECLKRFAESNDIKIRRVPNKNLLKRQTRHI